MNMEKNKIKTSTGEKIFTVFNYAFFTLLCLVMLYPFWHEIMLSFSSLEASMKGGIFLWPKGFNLDTYKSVFKNPNIYTGFRTTIIVTIAGTALGTLLTAMTAYPLSKSRLRGGKVLMTLVLFTMIFSAGMIPSFLLIQNIGLMDNILALILPGLVSAYNCIIMKSFFLSIPESLEESARIDGANDLTILFRILLPLSVPILVTFALYYGVERWNEWYNGMLFIRSFEKRPLQLVLRGIIQTTGQAMVTNELEQYNITPFSEGIKMACVVVTMTPIILVYPFIQKYFVSGMTVGAVKG